MFIDSDTQLKSHKKGKKEKTMYSCETPPLTAIKTVVGCQGLQFSGKLIFLNIFLHFLITINHFFDERCFSHHLLRSGDFHKHFCRP